MFTVCDLIYLQYVLFHLLTLDIFKLIFMPTHILKPNLKKKKSTSRQIKNYKLWK